MRKWTYVLALTLTAGMAIAGFVRGSDASDAMMAGGPAVDGQGALSNETPPSDVCPGRALHAQLDAPSR
jgi:hypothetical protein